MTPKKGLMVQMPFCYHNWTLHVPNSMVHVVLKAASYSNLRGAYGEGLDYLGSPEEGCWAVLGSQDSEPSSALNYQDSWVCNCL